MTLHQPDTVILDLGSAITEYEREIKDLDNVLETDPGEMVSWLSCYVGSREYAEDQLDVAIMDAVGCASCNNDISDAALGKFSDAALGLGLSLIKKLEESGLFAHEDGEFPYTYSSLLGKAAVFRRTGSLTDNH
ncbi:hypothetical protein [Paraburkholderia adhaesiva]|uniref:hypothetical protein n=1 Tax=Paraburkholderia adhaesiva TaxID=2883244 RepID=UPI001F3F68BE|nr:hypothetical protein [Paraburkholderia adhaesiva]